MGDGLDLYVLNSAGWQYHASYDRDDKDQAVEITIDLKMGGGYKALCLVDDEKCRVIYSYNSLGPDFNYSSFQESLRNPPKPKRAAPVKRPPQPPKEEPVQQEPLNEDQLNKRFQVATGVSGGIITLSLTGLMVARVDGFVVLSALAPIALGCGAWVFTTYNQLATFQKEAAEKKRAAQEKIEAEQRKQRALTEASIIIAQIVREGKKHSWSQAHQRMMGDSHFGLMLYLAGFGKTLSTFLKLSNEDIFDVIAKHLAEINIARENALRCFDNLNEFMPFHRYAQMHRFGEQAASRRMQNPEADLLIVPALERWEEKKADADAGDTIDKASAVLFTDIVNFTQTHQDKGDEWMVDVVKAHNEVVRAALSSYKGKEIKHTGDGIMASFPSLQYAVEAAITMQKGFHTFSQKVPERALNVRIGISDGEPVHLDGDIFGTPVNMAARVMPFGGTMEITISDTAHAFCQNQNLPYIFEEIPECELKGFGTRSVYKILWQQMDTQAPPANETVQAVAGQAAQSAANKAPTTYSAQGQQDKNQPQAAPTKTVSA